MSPFTAGVAVRRLLAKRPWLYWLVVGAAALGVAASMLERSDRIDDARDAWGETTTVWVATRSLAPGDAVLAEAREGHIDGGVRLQIAEEPGEQLVVPITGDTVEGQTQQSRLLDADVQPDDRHRGHPESASSDQALVTADDRGVLPPDEDRLDESELAQAAGQRV